MAALNELGAIHPQSKARYVIAAWYLKSQDSFHPLPKCIIFGQNPWKSRYIKNIFKFDTVLKIVKSIWNIISKWEVDWWILLLANINISPDGERLVKVQRVVASGYSVILLLRIDRLDVSVRPIYHSPVQEIIPNPSFTSGMHRQSLPTGWHFCFVLSRCRV